MSDAAQNPAAAPRPADVSTGPALGPLALWLLVQLAALAVSALRLPLAAKHPRPQEVLALHVMLTAQVSAAALLFPVLMRDARTAAAAVSTAWPFLMLAAALAAVPVARAAVAGAYVTAWLVALALWRPALREARWQSFGVAVATLLSVGGGLVTYLTAEFGADGGTSPRAAWTSLGPVTASLRIVSGEPGTGAVWVLPPLLAAAALAASWVRNTSTRR